MTTTKQNIINFKGDSDKLVETLWSDLPKHQKEANREFLKDTHRMLKEGGKWVYPRANIMFQKIGNEWIYKDIHNELIFKDMPV